MASATCDPTRAATLSHAESLERTANLKAGGAMTPLAFERFDLAAARCELDRAHRVFQCHPCARPSNVCSMLSAATASCAGVRDDAQPGRPSLQRDSRSA